jgi:hypothetical protein
MRYSLAVRFADQGHFPILSRAKLSRNVVSTIKGLETEWGN